MDNNDEIIKMLQNEVRTLKNRIDELEKELQVHKAGQKALDDQDTIQDIYKRYLQGQSLGDIAEAFNTANIKTKRGGKWYKTTIKNILQNMEYVQKGYVSEEDFQDVQKKLKENRLNGGK